MSRVGRLATNLIEPLWLLALVAVPLFFNTYSFRVFEPDKLGVFRALSLAIALLVIVGVAQYAAKLRSRTEMLAGVRGLLKTPLVVPALATAAVYLFSTAWSVEPRTSLLGSYQRLQGTVSTLCYVALFASLLLYLRRREQLERLLTLIVITSFPIALYGILQHHGMDPLPWQGDVSARVASSLGNPIFLGAYLGMVIPITISHMLLSPPLEWASRDRTRRRLALVVCLCAALLQAGAWLTLSFATAALVSLLALAASIALARKAGATFAVASRLSLGAQILVVQIVALLFCGSRGPQVGLLAGLCLFGLLIVALRRRRGLAIGVVAASVLMVALLVTANIPSSPLAAIRDVPYLGRLGRLLEVDRGTGRVRVLIWQGSIDLLRSDPLRAVIGYGPETMHLVYNRYYPAELAQVESRTASPDRAHNETFDALITTGLLGLAVQLVLFMSVVHLALRSLGLVPSRRARDALFLLSGMGGALGVLLPPFLEGSLRLSGVGLPLGIAAGVFLYVAACALRGTARPTPLAAWQQMLAVALLAALVAHWLEISVGIAIAATRVHFWCYAAIALCLTRESMRSPSGPEGLAAPAIPLRRPDARHHRRAPGRSRGIMAPPVQAATAPAGRARVCTLALALSAIPVTLAWNLLVNSSGTTNPWHVLAEGFSGGQPGGIVAFGPLWLVALLFPALALPLFEQMKAPTASGRPDARLRTLAGSAAMLIIAPVTYTLLLAFGLVKPTNPSALLTGYALMLLFIAGGMSAALHRSSDRKEGKGRAAALIPLSALWLGALALGWAIGMAPIRADMVFKQGLAHDAARSWEAAAIAYEQAVDAAPAQDYYILYAGRARLEQAKASHNPAVAADLLNTALEHLNRARELSPLNTDHTANLARAHRTWADSEPDLQARTEHLEEASALYAEATELSPNNAILMNEWGMTFASLGDAARARECYERSLALDDRYATTFLLLSDLAIGHEDWTAALPYLERASELSPSSPSTWGRLAYVYANLQRWTEAIAANETVLELQPDDYTTLRNLIYIYTKQQDVDMALYYLERALPLAPEGDRATLDALHEQLTQ